MTTTVTVKTHSWPVRVWSYPLVAREPVEEGEWQNLADVPPNSEQSFVVHDGQDICVRELPDPATQD